MAEAHRIVCALVNRIIVLSVLLLAGCLLGAEARAEARSALVIGNGAYASAPLANAVNDAVDMATVLEELGFEVILATDASLRGMDEAIDEFSENLEREGGVGVFYYSGHGVQVGGDNFLLPIGDEVTNERDVKYGALNAAKVIDVMEGSRADLSIVVLDACRNNPLQSEGRSATRGLSRVSTGGAGLFVSFSTAPGEVALDGDGRNSPYTKHLLAALEEPGLKLEEVFKEALKGVHNETRGRQVPWISSSFYGEFIFNTAAGTQIALAEDSEAPLAPGKTSAGSGGPSRQAGLIVPLAAPAAAARDLDGIYSVAGSNPNGTHYRGMARIIGTSADGDFKLDWWIGRQRFAGDGRRDGRWMRVDWGSSSPVIYTLRPDGVLDGLWADGSATETLAPYALASLTPDRNIEGSYDVEGRNENGRRYSGTAWIERSGSGWRMRWSIGQSVYTGAGKLDGGIFTVDWGQSSPVVYAVSAEGKLTGLWASGKGSELLSSRQ